MLIFDVAFIRFAAIAHALSWRHWRGRWNQSLRFRWLALGLMPLLVAFPIIILLWARWVATGQMPC